jgi:hypothetical protein
MNSYITIDDYYDNFVFCKNCFSSMKKKKYKHFRFLKNALVKWTKVLLAKVNGLIIAAKNLLYIYVIRI